MTHIFKRIEQASNRFKIALSFPGEDRDFVLKVAEKLAEKLGRDQVFYDNWYEVDLIGNKGDIKLQSMYKQADLVVPFFSKHYTKPWCSLEWDTIRGILLNRRAEDAVIPVHLDETYIEGWPEVNFGIRLQGRTPQAIANIILQSFDKRNPTDISPPEESLPNLLFIKTPIIEENSEKANPLLNIVTKAVKGIYKAVKGIYKVKQPIDSEKANLMLNIVTEAAQGIYNVKQPKNPIIDSLGSASLVIVYLGDQSMNALKEFAFNIGMKVGYRVGVKKPLIVLTNEDTDLQQQIPFDCSSCSLESSQFFCQSPIIPSWTKLDQLSSKSSKQTINDLSKLLKQVRLEIISSYAVAEIFIDNHKDHKREQRRANSIFTMSSEETNRLFHVEGSVAGLPLDNVLEKIKPLIELDQWQSFNDEQDILIKRLLDRETNTPAKEPFIFKDSADVSIEFRGKAFLAIITQLIQESNHYLLKMLYYEVPNPAK